MKPRDRGQGALEPAIGRVLQFGTVASSILFAAGLLFALIGGPDRAVHIALTSAIVILFATPTARVVISIVEYFRERDWLFVALTSIVLLTLAGSVVVAFWSAGG